VAGTIPVPAPRFTARASEPIQTGVGAVWNNLPVTPTAASHHDWFLVACAAGTVVVLLVMIAKVRLHPALALMIAALGLGVASVCRSSRSRSRSPPAWPT